MMPPLKLAEGRNANSHLTLLYVSAAAWLIGSDKLVSAGVEIQSGAWLVPTSMATWLGPSRRNHQSGLVR